MDEEQIQNLLTTIATKGQVLSAILTGKSYEDLTNNIDKYVKLTKDYVNKLSQNV